MGEKESVKKILDINHEAKVIITSGYSNDPILSDYKKYGFCGVVTKPYTFDQLYFEIAMAINSSC
ncbi:MAG: hypothetical protein MUD12_07240 [Spirochaetes bacterium]|jgi:FixJ family two-component response regulator|nr:hypothetical protein [Spirochaetota bacterium]